MIKNKLNTIIIDDHQDSIDDLTKALTVYGKSNIIKTYTSSEKAFQDVPNYKLDLLFIDIEMPEKNGLEFVNSLPEVDFEIVFVTGFQDYALEAIQ